MVVVRKYVANRRRRVASRTAGLLLGELQAGDGPGDDVLLDLHEVRVRASHSENRVESRAVRNQHHDARPLVLIHTCRGSGARWPTTRPPESAPGPAGGSSPSHRAGVCPRPPLRGRAAFRRLPVRSANTFVDRLFPARRWRPVEPCAQMPAPAIRAACTFRICSCYSCRSCR